MKMSKMETEMDILDRMSKTMFEYGALPRPSAGSGVRTWEQLPSKYKPAFRAKAKAILQAALDEDKDSA
jgi:hypothetical protein